MKLTLSIGSETKNTNQLIFQVRPAISLQTAGHSALHSNTHQTPNIFHLHLLFPFTSPTLENLIFRGRSHYFPQSDLLTKHTKHNENKSKWTKKSNQVLLMSSAQHGEYKAHSKSAHLQREKNRGKTNLENQVNFLSPISSLSNSPPTHPFKQHVQ